MPVELGGSGTIAEGQADQLAELEAIEQNTGAVAGTLTSGAPIGSDPKLNVGISTSVTLPVEIVGGQAVSALPEAGAEGFATYPIGLAPAEPVDETGVANPVFVRGVAQVAGEVSQGRGASPDTSDPWIVATSDGVSAQQIATKEGQDAIELAVSSLQTSLADHATLSEQQTQTGHLSTIEAEVTGVAKDTSVDEVEAKLGTLTAQESTTAKDATLTNGTQKSIVRGGTKGTTTAADVTSTALGPDHQGLDVTTDADYDYSPGRESTGAYKVSGRVALFNNVNQYFLDTRAWGSITATGGTVTYNSTTGSVDIAVTNTPGSLAVLQSHTYFPYEPEATTHPLFTIAFGNPVQVNQLVRIGYFNDLDGVFYERTSTSLRLVRRSSVSGVAVDTLLSDQANWRDPYSDLDLLFGNRWGLDLQWLSFGKVKAIINDRVVQVQELGNSLTMPYMRTAQLPLRFEIRNTGASVANSIRYTCSSVSLHGGTDLKTTPGLYPLSAPRAGVPTTPTTLLGLRVSALLAGRANRGLILPTSATVTAESGSATIDLYFNPTSITGGSWAPINSTYGVEFNEGITSITGGERAGHVIIPATGAGGGTAELDGRSFFSILGAHMRVAVDGTLDTMVFVGNARVGTVTLDLVARWLRAG